MTYAAVIHVDDPVTVGCKIFIMSHNDKRGTDKIAEFKKQAMEIRTIFRIEAAGRFVGKHHRRIIDKRTRHRCPLTLPS